MDTNVGNIVGSENKPQLNKIYSLPRQPVITQPPMSVVIRWWNGWDVLSGYKINAH